MYLRRICTIVFVAKSYRDYDNHCWTAIAKYVKIAVQEAFVVDDAHNNQVEVYALDAHPCESSQKEIMQQPSNN